jgi:U3 small nucleolar RNA-associated protein 7
MVSAGQDLKMAVWDIRMFREVNRYFLRQPGSSLAVSDRGLTAVGWGTQVSVWKGLFDKESAEQEKVKSPYMAWGADGKHIERVRWCPFEDVLGAAHDKGFSSLLIPGAGEPNFDALEANPYENRRQRQEAEVKALLNKLQPDMISLDPDFVGNVDLATPAQRRSEMDEDRGVDDKGTADQNNKKKKTRRGVRRAKGHKNIIDEKRMRIEAKFAEGLEAKREQQKRTEEELGPALARFARRGRP